MVEGKCSKCGDIYLIDIDDEDVSDMCKKCGCKKNKFSVRIDDFKSKESAERFIAWFVDASNILNIDVDKSFPERQIEWDDKEATIFIK